MSKNLMPPLTENPNLISLNWCPGSEASSGEGLEKLFDGEDIFIYPTE